MFLMSNSRPITVSPSFKPQLGIAVVIFIACRRPSFKAPSPS